MFQSCMRFVVTLFFVGAMGLPVQSAPPRDFKADPAAVQWCGPAYRFSQQGWIVVHIEGKPYERGYQYGKLLAKEIAGYAESLGVQQCAKAPEDGLSALRTMTNALFLRKYDQEFLEEMKGIADGALSEGAKVYHRDVDLLDVVTINSSVELGLLDAALDATPTGLEGKDFKEPPYARKRKIPATHCSAFAATGPATKDGQVVFGHITMWGLFGANYFNVWLDVKPEKGHRVMMQTYPGGIMSGMDYYQNDAGILLTETTISQTKFDVNGWSLTARCRKSVQYADTIDDCVKYLVEQNNGLYSNEWLIADVKTNEIAMLELGTQKHKLWRSSKNEWPGGTPGFYWGCNNTKDLQVRLETQACLDCRPANMAFHPSNRDVMWLKLYDEFKGKMDENFGFKAFTTPPLAAYPSLDAKFTTTALAKDFKSWGLFGPPLGKTWEPSDFEKKHFDFKIQPLISNDWTMLSGVTPAKNEKNAAGDVKGSRRFISVDKSLGEAEEKGYEDASVETERNPVWNGTLLPKTDADLWLTTAFADFERIVAAQRQNKNDAEALNRALYGHWIKYKMATQRLGKDIPLASTKSDPRGNDWYDLAAGKGVLVLAKLRQEVGGKAFDRAMESFGRDHAGKEVTVEEFRAHLEKASGKNLEPIFQKYVQTTQPSGDHNPVWSLTGWEKNIEQTMIIYGTQAEAAANRETAVRLQDVIAQRWGNYRPIIKADVDITTTEIKDKNLLLIGRPEANALSAKLQGQFPIKFGLRSFEVNGTTYASEKSAVITAAAHPDHAQRCVVLLAGLSAEATWKLPTHLGGVPCEALVVSPEGTKAVVMRRVGLE
jgi:hypothetical protein